MKVKIWDKQTRYIEGTDNVFKNSRIAFDTWVNESQHSSTKDFHCTRDHVPDTEPDLEGNHLAEWIIHEMFAAFRAGIRFGQTGNPFKPQPSERDLELERLRLANIKPEGTLEMY